jgi:hypothetical protein
MKGFADGHVLAAIHTTTPLLKAWTKVMVLLRKVRKISQQNTLSLLSNFIFIQSLKPQGVEKFSDALGQCRGMAEVIHGNGALNGNDEIIWASRIDSQARHGVLAQAGAKFYACLTSPGYVEWIWDHVAGKVVIKEAGGTMTDVEGSPIDFSLGDHLLADVTGVLASNGGVFHSALVSPHGFFVVSSTITGQSLLAVWTNVCKHECFLYRSTSW